MRAKPTSIQGCFVIEFPVYQDDRGQFREWFKSDQFEAAVGKKFTVSQANVSQSKRGVIRGIHYSRGRNGQGKLITCTAGSIWDVVVDLREDSVTFGKWISTELNYQDGKAVFVPEGLGHGFQATSNDATITYLLSTSYDPNVESEINPYDPDLEIKWPLEDAILSIKDHAAPSMRSQRKNGLLPW
jgi:dTDP-4-dehydrorhamnose 3,5-epimerase